LIGFCGWGYSEKFRTAYWMHLLEGAQECAAREGQSVVLLDPKVPHGWSSVDGVLTSNTYESAELEYLPEGIPRVSLLYALRGITSVAADNYQGGRLATEFLVNSGHRRIACLGILDTPLVRLRLAGYRDALEVAGIESHPDWVRPFGPVGFPQPNFRERGKAIMSDWLQNGWKEQGCTALLAQNDLVAIGAIDALQEVGLSVPDDISVIGFNGTEIGEVVSPRLTSIAVPLAEIGALGLETLLRLINSRKVPVTTLMLETSLIERASTRVLEIS
jgi:LacI family transcriptional regulator